MPTEAASMLHPQARIFSTFDDPAIAPETWSRLLSEGDTDQISLTWLFLRLWWEENHQERELAIITVENDSSTRVIAPLFVDSGMVFNLCPVQALDFVGDVGDPAVLDALLQTARDRVRDFVGFRFYHVPHTSRTGRRLQQAAGRLGLDCFLEDEQPSPIIDLRGKPGEALACTRKKTPLRRERQLLNGGRLEVGHFRETCSILGQLDDYFQLHVDRWQGTPTPSQFIHAEARESCRERTRLLGDRGWLRFSRLVWNDRPIAFAWNTCYRGHFKYGKPAHATAMDHLSPGAVLLRHVLLAAIEEGAHTFDFGFGAEEYKYRYATDSVLLQTWGLYPSSS